jgi:hypothetical protein
MVTSDSSPRPSRWRTALSVSLIVIAAILIPLTMIAGWARVTVFDTDRYVETVSELADDSAIQSAVSAKASQVIDARLTEFAANTRLTAPEQQAIDAAVAGVVQSDEFATIWETANRVAHTQVKALLTGEDVAGVQTSGGRIVIDVAAVIVAIDARLTSMGYDVDLDTALANVVTALLRNGLIVVLAIGIIALAIAVFAERRVRQPSLAGGAA